MDINKNEDENVHCNNNSNNSNMSNVFTHRDGTPLITRRVTKGLFERLKCGVKLVDDLITQFYGRLTGSFDSIIAEVEISPLMKKILHSKQILFYFIIFSNFLLIYYNISMQHSETYKGHMQFHIKAFIYYSFMFSFDCILILILILKLRPTEDMYLKQHSDLETHILSNNKDLANNFCNECKVTKCMRSYHCKTCNKCVVKFELHSDWFHICIGSMNCFIYTIILILLNFFFLTVMLNFSFQIFYFGRSSELYDLRGKEVVFHFWSIIQLYLTVKLCKFSGDFIRNGAMRNITDFEGYNWRRLPYMWKTMRKEFFNPFDKGVKLNLLELWVSFVNKEIGLKDKINMRIDSNQNLNNSLTDKDDDVLILNVSKKEETGSNTSNTNDTTVNTSDITNTNTITRNHSDSALNKTETPPFVTSDSKVIYRHYSGNSEDLLNWTRVRFYTIFDLRNSPLREVVIKQIQMQSNSSNNYNGNSNNANNQQ